MECTKMATVLFSLLCLLLCCFSAEAALTNQKVQKSRASKTLTAQLPYKLALDEAKTSSDSDDDDDDDSDDDQDDDPAKAPLRKELIENLREQSQLKKSLRQISDKSKSDQEIDGYAQLVANETQSPAMGNMLAKMWKDMRLFEAPEYKEHVEGKIAHLKREERSKEDELADTAKAKTRNTPSPVAGGVRAFGNDQCPCIGVDNLVGETIVKINKEGKKASYPADLGARCEAWDLSDHPKCPGEKWCEQKWCYVDPCNCNIPVLPKVANYLPGAQYQGKPLYFSYATCGGQDSYTAEKDKKTAKLIKEACAADVDSDKWGEEDCRCVGIGPQPGTTKVNIKNKTYDFPADTGATCSAWEEDNHPDCQGKNPPDWCGQAWCYVDPCKCKSATPPKTSSYLPESTAAEGRPIYYSYATCGADDSYSAGDKKACVSQKTSNACAKLEKCAWTGKDCLGKELVGVCQDGGAAPVKASAFSSKGLVALLLPLLAFVQA